MDLFVSDNFVKTTFALLSYNYLNKLYRNIVSKKLNNLVILITGASSGIGRCMSLKLAKEGAIVILWDINTPINVQKEIESLGGIA